MEPTDSHYRLKDLFTNPAQRKRALKLAFENSVPIAFYAYGVFARSAKVLEDGRMDVSADSRMIKKGWLYIDPDALLGLLDKENKIEVGMFRSKPDSDLDIWATKKNGEKIKLGFDDLWIHEGMVSAIDQRDTASDDGLHKRTKGNMLRIIGVLLSELRKSTGYSQTRIIDELTDLYPLTTGIKKSNLQNYFAAANLALKDY